MKQYHDLITKILQEGSKKDDRTGTGTISLFGHQMRFSLSEGFPLVTTKKLYTKAIVHELLWFLRGDTNNNSLKDVGVTIWNEWAAENGALGPVYGHQWRRFGERKAAIEIDGKTTTVTLPGVDQITELIQNLKTNPHSRRHIVSAWNPIDLEEMALPPCHSLFQFYVSDGTLSCQLYQRSADVFLGVPFNIASYALLTHMIAEVCEFKVGDFVHSFGDVHLYANHVEQAVEQISRIPRSLPTLKIHRKVQNIFEFKYEDFSFENYDPHPAIKAPVAI